jgi:2-oxoglutarate dehydrogenase E2 component (dihydrolipoamide succinyltransferase)
VPRERPVPGERWKGAKGESMSITVELPSLGESVVEGTIARWLVKQGDRVEVDQPLVEVTTDKVDAEIPSPTAGVIEKILVEEGDVVPVGGQLALIGEGAGAEARGPSPSEEPREATASAPSEPRPAPAEPGPGAPMEAKATPVARRVAEEANVDLGRVEGTGAAGRITKSDVLRHTQPEPSAPPESAPRPAAPAPASAERPSYAQVSLEEGDRVVPMTPLRRLVAEHMVYSKRTSPHVGTVAEVDMSGVVRARRQSKDAFERSQGFRLTFLPFIVNAVVRALKENPRLNASVTEDAIVEKAGIHMGIAVETDKGLMVPVIRNAERLSLAGQAAAIEDLSTRARNKKLSPDDLRGGTFTISNPGRQGNLYGFAIINQPQVAILRMGEMVKRPVVIEVDGEDTIAIRPMMHIALSYDHRAVDGQPANGFLYRVRELLEAAEFDV